MLNGSILKETYRIKKSYQRSLAWGFGVAGLTQILIVVTVFLYTTSNCSGPNKIIAPTHGDSTITFINPPIISESKIPDRINTGSKVKPSDIGLPTPVPDTEITVDPLVPTQDQLAGLAPELPIDDLGDGIILDTTRIFNEILPAPDTFIPYDEPPVLVAESRPVYPELAGRAGIECVIWIKALIDKEGVVRDVLIVSCSNPNVGFEESAIAAARQATWKPAISNGLPLAVWITYKVEFKSISSR